MTPGSNPGAPNVSEEENMPGACLFGIRRPWEPRTRAARCTDRVTIEIPGAPKVAKRIERAQGFERKSGRLRGICHKQIESRRPDLAFKNVSIPGAPMILNMIGEGRT